MDDSVKSAYCAPHPGTLEARVIRLSSLDDWKVGIISNRSYKLPKGLSSSEQASGKEASVEDKDLESPAV